VLAYLKSTSILKASTTIIKIIREKDKKPKSFDK
jgi:hypothetical protein